MAGWSNTETWEDIWGPQEPKDQPWLKPTRNQEPQSYNHKEPNPVNTGWTWKLIFPKASSKECWEILPRMRLMPRRCQKCASWQLLARRVIRNVLYWESVLLLWYLLHSSLLLNITESFPSIVLWQSDLVSGSYRFGQRLDLTLNNFPLASLHHHWLISWRLQMPFLAVWHRVPRAQVCWGTQSHLKNSLLLPIDMGFSIRQLDPTHAVSTLDADMERCRSLFSEDGGGCLHWPASSTSSFACLLLHQAMDISGFSQPGPIRFWCLKGKHSILD